VNKQTEYVTREEFGEAVETAKDLDKQHTRKFELYKANQEQKYSALEKTFEKHKKETDKKFKEMIEHNNKLNEKYKEAIEKARKAEEKAENAEKVAYEALAAKEETDKRLNIIEKVLFEVCSMLNEFVRHRPDSLFQKAQNALYNIRDFDKSFLPLETSIDLINDNVEKEESQTTH